MTVLRRFLVLAALMFWQGGFTFYSGRRGPCRQCRARVAPGPGPCDALGDQLPQPGRRRRDRRRRLGHRRGERPELARRLARWGLWAILVIGLAILVWLHGRLDELIDVASENIVDRPRFRALHRGYLYVGTVQWAASLILIALTLLAWRSADNEQRLPKTIESDLGSP